MIGPFKHLFLLRDLGFCRSGGEHYHLWGPVEKNIIRPGCPQTCRMAVY